MGANTLTHAHARTRAHTTTHAHTRAHTRKATKRVHDDPVLAQLDFLINGPPKAPRLEQPQQEHEQETAAAAAPPPLAPNPVLAQLDALINGAPAPAPATAPPLLAPLAAAETADDDELRGPPGILREFGGVRGWMARHAERPTRATPSSPAMHRKIPSDQTS